MSLNKSAILPAVKQLLSDVAHLRVPTVAVGVVGTIVEVLPGVHISAPATAAALTGVGVIASFIENLLNGSKPSVAEVTGTVKEVEKDVRSALATPIA